MTGFLESISSIFGVARRLAFDSGVQKWSLFYAFFLASFMTLFSMFRLVHANDFAVVFVFCLLLYVCYFAGIVIFSVRLVAESFRVLGIKTRNFGFGLVTYLAGFSQGLISVLLLKDRRTFLFFAFVFLLFVASSFFSFVVLRNPLLSIIFLMLLFLAAIPYVILLAYHATRLCFAQLFYLSGRTFSDSIEESWAMVSGRTLSTFGVLVVASLVSCCIMLPISIVNVMFSSVLQVSAEHFEIPLTPIFSLFLDVFSFPFAFLLILVSIGLTLFYFGTFYFLLKETGRLPAYSDKARPAARKKAK
jgi:hypothetical protein